MRQNHDDRTFVKPSSSVWRLSKQKIAMALQHALYKVFPPHSWRATVEDILTRQGDTTNPTERYMIHNLLYFSEKRVEDVMVPRADIIAVDVTMSLEDLLDIFRTCTHSRVPVYRQTLDDPLGMVHLKDVVFPKNFPKHQSAPTQSCDGQGRKGTTLLKDIIREIIFVPPSMSALNLLAKMQATHTHLALVVDEHGGTDGLVSIENLVEEIVGEIQDEHDSEAEYAIVKKGPGIFEVDARTPVSTLEDHLDMPLLLGEQMEDIDTLGGLVFALAGRVPQRREIITHPQGLEFEITEADPRRIKRLRVLRTSDRKKAPSTK